METSVVRGAVDALQELDGACSSADAVLMCGLTTGMALLAILERLDRLVELAEED